MEVNILVTGDPEHPSAFLVLPFDGAPQLPLHLQRLGWRNLATTTTDDRLLRNGRAQIEAELNRQGYAIVTPEFLAGSS